jgi:hypothetical protein
MTPRRLSLWWSLLFLILAAAAPASAWQAAPQPTMTNADLVKLVQAGVPESAIIASIHSSAPAFDLSSDGIVALHKAGVTQGELEAAIAASSAAHPATAPAARWRPPHPPRPLRRPLTSRLSPSSPQAPPGQSRLKRCNSPRPRTSPRQ